VIQNDSILSVGPVPLARACPAGARPLLNLTGKTLNPGFIGFFYTTTLYVTCPPGVRTTECPHQRPARALTWPGASPTIPARGGRLPHPLQRAEPQQRRSTREQVTGPRTFTSPSRSAVLPSAAEAKPVPRPLTEPGAARVITGSRRGGSTGSAEAFPPPAAPCGEVSREAHQKSPHGNPGHICSVTHREALGPGITPWTMD